MSVGKLYRCKKRIHASGGVPVAPGEVILLLDKRKLGRNRKRNFAKRISIEFLFKKSVHKIKFGEHKNWEDYFEIMCQNEDR